MAAHPSSSLATLVILAGGRGRRMGQPKSLLRLDGKPILEHLLDQMQWPGPTLLVTSKRLPDPPGSARFDRTVQDQIEDQGPLQAILSALRHIRSPLAIIATCDMPALSHSHLQHLLSRLTERPDCLAVMLRRNLQVQPFPLACRAPMADLVAAQLETADRSVQSLVASGGVEVEEAPADWPGAVWTNLNTPDDLENFSAAHKRITRWQGGNFSDATDELAQEEPLEIRVRNRSISVAMRTPGHDDELAAGFLLTEGIIQTRADILRIDPCEKNEFGNIINVQLSPQVAVDFARLTRHVFAASSCGMCGKASIESIRSQFPPIQNCPEVDPQILLRLPDKMREQQITFDRTGGLHAAAIFDTGGHLLVLREDVARHNAVDKVLGRAFLDGLLPLSRHILLVSGRVSFEIMQKSLAAGVPIVAAVSAPSTLAVDFARANGQKLVGFLRGDRMNIY